MFPQTPFPSRLHNIGQSSLYYTVGPYWLSILNTAVCTRPSQLPNYPFPSSFPLATINSFSKPVNLVLFCSFYPEQNKFILSWLFKFHIEGMSYDVSASVWLTSFSMMLFLKETILSCINYTEDTLITDPSMQTDPLKGSWPPTGPEEMGFGRDSQSMAKAVLSYLSFKWKVRLNQSNALPLCNAKRNSEQKQPEQRSSCSKPQQSERLQDACWISSERTKVMNL